MVTQKWQQGRLSQLFVNWFLWNFVHVRNEVFDKISKFSYFRFSEVDYNFLMQLQVTK